MEIKKSRIVNYLCYLSVLFISYTMKLYYASASSDDLLFILYPISKIVSAFTGFTFSRISEGFINETTGVLINSGCAGVNFLIIFYLSTTFSFLHKIDKLKFKIIFMIILLPLGYLSTLLINSFRIISSIVIIKENSLTYLSPEKTHLFIGVTIFFTYLLIFHSAVNKIFFKEKNNEIHI